MYVDLSRGRTHIETLPSDILGRFLGGRGLGAHILLRERVYGCDPLSPANPLIFVPGALTGSGAPAAGRFSVSSRSPLTGTAFDGSSGGTFGVALRRLDLDYLIVTGAAPAPAVLVLGRETPDDATSVSIRLEEDGDRSVETALCPADGLWGLDVPRALTGLRRRFGGCEAAVIGPAGERGVLFATIANARGRQVGRGGLGAVMGAKQLKAIVVDTRFAPPPVPAGGARMTSLAADLRRCLDEHPATSFSLPEFGTSVLVEVLAEAGALPARNFRGGRFDAAAIGSEALRRTLGNGRSSCPGCPVGCGRRVSGGAGSTRGPEYESLWALGADCGVDDLSAIVRANEVCNEAGLDTISMGATIACAMELTEAGALAGGPLFGDATAVLELITATAERRGLGDELALGSARFATAHGAPDLSMSVKSLELPGFDPRGMSGQGLAFATSNRGACHQRASMVDPELVGTPVYLDRFASLGKSSLLIELQDRNAVLDSLGTCRFAACAFTDDHLAALLSAHWGIDVRPDGLRRAGERIWCAEKLFNLAAGFSRKDDDLPRRLTREPLSEGPSAGHVVDLVPMLDEYYACRGWDASGRPPDALLEDLGLGWVRTADPGACGDRTAPATARR